MARQPNIQRPIKLTTTLPEDIRGKLDLHLFSDAEGRVPKGAYQGFLIERIKDFFENVATLDLAEYLEGIPPGVYTIHTRRSTLDLLIKALESKHD